MRTRATQRGGLHAGRKRRAFTSRSEGIATRYRVYAKGRKMLNNCLARPARTRADGSDESYVRVRARPQATYLPRRSRLKTDVVQVTIARTCRGCATNHP